MMLFAIGHLEQWRVFRRIDSRHWVTVIFALDLSQTCFVLCARRPFGDAAGTLLPYAAAIRSSVTSRRMLWARFCKPILALARAIPIVRTIRPPGEVC